MPTVPRHALGTTRHEPGRHLAAGVPRDFVDVLARAPTLAAALTLAMVALCIATRPKQGRRTGRADGRTGRRRGKGLRRVSMGPS
jgi:hypothetical protein